jgi:Uma2 family endonuclease
MRGVDLEEEFSMEHPERALEIEEWEALVARGEVPGPMTVDEFFELDEVMYDGRREELLMGWRVCESWPITKHQLAMSNLNVLIGLHLIERKLGVIMAPSAGLVLDKEKRIMLVPDAAVVLHDRMHVISEKWLHATPNLVIEALSPSTSRRDRVTKLEWYGKYGADEYWIVDVKKEHIDVYDLTAGPGQPPVRFSGPEKLVSRVLPDLEIKVEWVFGPLHEQAIVNVFRNEDGSFGRGWPSTSHASRNGNRRYDTDPA